MSYYKYYKLHLYVNGDNDRIQNNNNNVTIVPLDKEDINDLSLLEWTDVFTSKENIFIKILENVNCSNPRHHNIYYNDLKSGFGLVYMDGKVKADKIKNILTRFIMNRITHIRTIINKLKPRLDKDFASWILSSLRKLETSQIKINELISHLKLILYNHAAVIFESINIIKMTDNIPKNNEILTE